MEVIYKGCSESQANFGQADDPRQILRTNDTYTIVKQEIHKWHTLYTLKGYPAHKFNSVCFEAKNK